MGHSAWQMVSWRNDRAVCVILKEGARTPFQVTLKAAGSQARAMKLCRIGCKRLLSGEGKTAVEEWKKACLGHAVPVTDAEGAAQEAPPKAKAVAKVTGVAKGKAAAKGKSAAAKGKAAAAKGAPAAPRPAPSKGLRDLLAGLPTFSNSKEAAKALYRLIPEGAPLEHRLETRREMQGVVEEALRTDRSRKWKSLGATSVGKAFDRLEVKLRETASKKRKLKKAKSDAASTATTGASSPERPARTAAPPPPPSRTNPPVPQQRPELASRARRFLLRRASPSGDERVVLMPVAWVGRLIGKLGANVKRFEEMYQVRARISGNPEDPEEQPGTVVLQGTCEAMDRAAAVLEHLKEQYRDHSKKIPVAETTLDHFNDNKEAWCNSVIQAARQATAAALARSSMQAYPGNFQHFLHVDVDLASAAIHAQGTRVAVEMAESLAPNILQEVFSSKRPGDAGPWQRETRPRFNAFE